MVQIQTGNGETMKVARIMKKSFISSGQIIVKENECVKVFPVVPFSKVKKTYVPEGIMLTWNDGSLGWKKRNIIVDVVE